LWLVVVAVDFLVAAVAVLEDSELARHFPLPQEMITRLPLAAAEQEQLVAELPQTIQAQAGQTLYLALSLAQAAVAQEADIAIYILKQPMVAQAAEAAKQLAQLLVGKMALVIRLAQRLLKGAMAELVQQIIQHIAQAAAVVALLQQAGLQVLL
jgi:hypothetical protein